MNLLKNHNYLLHSVKHGLRILKVFSMDQPKLGVTEIAHFLGLSKSTISRSIKILVQEGFLEKSPDSTKYILGLSLLSLSGIITSHMEIHREAKTTLKALVERLGESAHISVLEGANIVYLDKVECRHPVHLLSNIGKINPAFCTSSGKVLLAYQTEITVNRAIHAGLPAMGPNSITDPEIFRRNLIEIRNQGYAVCIDELHEGVVSIGAPIRNYVGHVIAAISVVGPRDRINDYHMPNFISAVVDGGFEISSKLGYLGGNA